MVLPAMVYKSDSRETMAHFRTVAAATKLPIIVYNNPVGYHADVTPEMFAQLTDVANLVAIKESSANTRRITEWLNEHRPEVTAEVHHGGQPLYPYLFSIE